jgi:hypothetical protein
MRWLISAPPSATASVSWCPQCGRLVTINLVEPDLKDVHKDRHVFECEACGLPHTYLIDRKGRRSKSPNININ